MTRSAVATPAFDEVLAARAVALERRDVVALGECGEPRGLRVEDRDLVVGVQRIDDREADLARADHEHLHEREAYSGASQTSARPVPWRRARPDDPRARRHAGGRSRARVGTEATRDRPRRAPSAGRSSRAAFEAPVLRDARARRPARDLRRRAERSDHPRRLGQADGVPRRPAGSWTSAASAASSVSRSTRATRGTGSSTSPTRRRQPEHRRALPLARDAGRCRARRSDPARGRRPVREPQRRPPRLRPGRAAVHEHRRRRRGRRSRGPRAGPAARSSGSCSTLNVVAVERAVADRRARAAEPVAVLVRPRERRPLHRRRRPGRGRGDRLHAAAQPGPRELRLGRVRGIAPLRGHAARPGRLVAPIFEYGRDDGQLHRDRRLRLPRARRGPPSAAATSSATTAAATSGASACETARRRASAASRSASRGSRRSARTPPARSSRPRRSARSTAST